MPGCPTPRGWTEERCPKGHERNTHEYLSCGATRCRQCDRDNHAKRLAAKEEGGDDALSILTVALVCGHTVLYRRGDFRPGDPTDPLFCARHEGFFGQGRPVP